jgi:hypothetical protein
MYLILCRKTKKLTTYTFLLEDDCIAISALLESLDQNLDDNDTSGSGMMMVENSSIHSEDIDVDQSTLLSSPRPCAFIAPPPPSEPPPDDTEPVNYNMIMNGRVDTVDVGVETSDDSASYDPVSTRSSTESPVSSKYFILILIVRKLLFYLPILSSHSVFRI